MDLPGKVKDFLKHRLILSVNRKMPELHKDGNFKNSYTDLLLCSKTEPTVVYSAALDVVCGSSGAHLSNTEYQVEGS